MGYVEAQNGRWGIYGDVVWGKFDFSDGVVTQRNPIANLKVSARANAGLGYEITMAESGLTYEVARWAGASSSTALDLLGGARYWNQDLNLSLAVDASVDLGKLGLERSGSRAVARSGTLEWVDPFVGLRVRHELAPGRELQFLGDIGGFGVGSDLTWQLFAGYAFDFRNLAIDTAWPRRLSRAGCRLHAGQRSQQKQPRPDPPRPRRWIELPVVTSQGAQLK